MSAKICLPLVAVFVLSCFVLDIGCQNDFNRLITSGGYKLPQDAQYLIVAGKLVRPEQTFRLYVSIYQLFHPYLRIKAQLVRDGEEYVSSSVSFYEASTKRLELLVPDTVQAGKHKLVVEGLLSENGAELLFKNETELYFQPKYVSLMIQLDRPIYHPEQTVKFRIAGVTPTLKPQDGTMTIYVLDANRNVVMRWLSVQLNLGLYANEFKLSYPVKEGEWIMQIDGFGHIYEEKFRVEHWYGMPNDRRYEVNCSTPMYIMDTEMGISGFVFGEHISGAQSTGNATVRLTVKNTEKDEFLPGELNKTLPYITGETPFLYTMTQIVDEFGEVDGMELHFKCWVNDWKWLETQNATSVTRVVKDGVKIRNIGQNLRTFKPNIPFFVYFAVMRTDGTPYDGFFHRQIVVQTTYEGISSRTTPEVKMIIPDDNVVRYEVTPGDADDRIIVRAWHQFSNSKDEVVYYRYFSPRGRYLSVSTSTEKPKVDEYMIFTVRTNVIVDEINYLIMGAGNILLGNTLRMNSQQKSFAVALDRPMAPLARIVAYYVKEGEIVSDALNFYVEDTRLKGASITMNLGKDFTRNTIELVTKGSPGGMMSFVAADYEMYKRGATTFLTERKIVRELATYDVKGQLPYYHIWHHNDDSYESDAFFNAPTAGMDTNTTFEAAGLVLFTDLNTTELPDNFFCNISLGLSRCPSSRQCFELKRKCDGTLDCLDGYDEVACPLTPMEIPQPRKPDIENLQRNDNSFHLSEWIWQTTYVKPNGQVETRLKVPKDATDSQVLHGFMIHPDEGLLIAKDVINYNMARNFYMVLEAPANIRRGEQVGLQVSVHNQWDEWLWAIVMLHDSPDYKFVHVGEFGQVSSYAPRTSHGDFMTMVELRPGESKYVNFPIVPTMYEGEITARMSAYTPVLEDADEITMTITVDGVWIQDHTPYLIDLVNQGSIIIPDFDINIPEMFIHPETPYHLYVPESRRAEMNLFGDVVSPGFFEPFLTTDNVAGIPDDSGEGYMSDFAFNLRTLKYLQATNALSLKAANDAITYMRSSLMRQYAYMQADGSFKNFRRAANSSIWTTAFVYAYLHETLASEWNEQIYIQDTLVNRIASWLRSQQKSDGSFEEIGPIYDRNMEPNTVDLNGETQEWNVALTSYVVIALSKNARLTGDAKSKAAEAKQLGSLYLSRKWAFLSDPYQTAIVAYALNQADHSDKDNAFSKLQKMRRAEGGVYWSATPISVNPTEIVNTVHFMQPRDDFVNQGNAITATSYALMLYLGRNEWDNSRPIMEWLQTQRTTRFHWSGTQDTLVCLQALTDYSLRQTNRFIYQMELKLESTSSPGYDVIYNLNESNFADLFTSPVPIAWGQVKAYAKGTGYAVLQLTSEYSVEKEFLVDAPGYTTDADRVPVYKIEAEKIHFYGRNASAVDFRVCLSWSRTDISPAAGETVIHIDLPSGFVVARDAIEKLYAMQIPGLSRVRFKDPSLITFFSAIPTKRTCFEFTAHRWFPVANVSIQHIIHAFEYSETGLFTTQMYTVYTLFHQHICFVCGSYQCPYCPVYNAAPSIGQSWIMCAIGLLSALVLPYMYIRTENFFHINTR